MEIADVIEEVPTVCWCGKRAQCNTRYSDGKIVREVNASNHVPVTNPKICYNKNNSFVQF